VLECVVNISEGRNQAVIDAVAASGGTCVLDVHSDAWHNRSVLTLAGHDVEAATCAVASSAVALIDIRTHSGVHPRMGAIDVVPFVPLDTAGTAHAHDDLGPAIDAGRRFAMWAAAELGLPCFYYGPQRSLPDVRRHAFVTFMPDVGPRRHHPTAGACAVGARHALVAYNVWLATTDVSVATSLSAALRGPKVRTLGLAVEAGTQVSCNLVDPWAVGPAQVFDTVVELAAGAGTSVSRAELVGLAPRAVLQSIPPQRWAELDLDPSRTIEARLSGAAGERTVGSGG
jgi:glutamate formiminotransferase / 5-formyltetrahydrofolate cyclo-ligase